MWLFNLFKNNNHYKPDDNKMHIISNGYLSDEVSVNMPYKDICLTMYGQETGRDFTEVAIHVTDKLLENYYTLFYLEADDFGACVYKRRPCDKIANPFFADYYKFLQAHKMDENAFTEGFELFLLDKGLSAPFIELFAYKYEFCYYFRAYGYTEKLRINSFSEAKSYPKNNNCDIWFEYVLFPDYLSIVYNSEKINIDDLVQTIAEVLKMHGKTPIIELD